MASEEVVPFQFQVTPSAPASMEEKVEYLTQMVQAMGQHIQVQDMAIQQLKRQLDPMNNMFIFAGSASQSLAEGIAGYLGKPMGHATVTQFKNGECRIVIEENVRNKDVYIIQSTCASRKKNEETDEWIENSVNDNIMELKAMINALGLKSAKQITVIMPQYGYARQDRKDRPGVPITASMIGHDLTGMGIDRVMSVDLHCEQIQGMFGPRVPVDNLYGSVVAVNYFCNMNLEDVVIVSPDAGGVKRARAFMKMMNHGMFTKTGTSPNWAMVMVDKQRPRPGEVGNMTLIGSVEDVQGKTAIIVDDMIDTGGTLCRAADYLKELGTAQVFAFATHAVFSSPAPDNFMESGLDAVVVLDSVPLRSECVKVVQLPLAPLLGEAIRRNQTGGSVSALFDINEALAIFEATGHLDDGDVEESDDGAETTASE